MVAYIQSELFRSFKNSMLRIFLGLTLLGVILLTLFIKKIYGVEEFQMLGVWTTLSLLGAIILHAICLVFSFKTKDTKVQILSYGISREKLFIWDLITYQIVTAVGIIIMAMMAIVFTKIGEVTGLIATGNDYAAFIQVVGRIMLYSINCVNAFFGLAYITNNVSLGIIGHSILIPLVLQLLGLILINKQELLDILIYFGQIQPFNILQTFTDAPTPDQWSNIIVSFVYTFIAFVVPGLIVFKKKEIY